MSFVYDIADLYKAETTIPAAFETVQHQKYTSKDIRMQCRKYSANAHILSCIAEDIAWILQDCDDEEHENEEQVGRLWESADVSREGGINYAGWEEEN